jgi:hypothetical protein
VPLIGLLDLDHPAEVGVEFNGAADVVERVEIVGGIFGQEFDVVELPTPPDQFCPNGKELCTRVPKVGFPSLSNVRSRFSRIASPSLTTPPIVGRASVYPHHSQTATGRMQQVGQHNMGQGVLVLTPYRHRRGA